MSQRQYGAIRAAGTSVIERDSQKALVRAALGVTAYTGIMKKGPVGKAFRTKTRSEFLFKAGGRISESGLPDAALSFFKASNGAGELWLNRVTDGTEKKSQMILKTRRAIRSAIVQLDAGNGGRWAGKKQMIVDNYSAITETTLTLNNPPAALKIDELAGALVTLNGVPGRSYTVVSNTAGGILTFASSTKLVTDLDGSSDLLLAVDLANGGDGLAVKVREGTDDPANEWALDVYVVEGGISEKKKTWDNMSSDPAAPNYFVKVINDDSDSVYLLKATDLNDDTTPSADMRPANLSGVTTALSATLLTAKIYDEVVEAVADGMLVEMTPFTLGASVIKDVVTLTCSVAGVRARRVYTQSDVPADGDTVVINGMTITWKSAVVTAATQVLIGGTASISLDNMVAFINASVNVLLDDVVFAEKTSASTMTVFACTSGTAGNSITCTKVGANGSWAGVTLATGVDQVWTYASASMPFITGHTVISGVAKAAINDYGAGFTVKDLTKDSTKIFAVADTITITIIPFIVNELAGGHVFPDVDDHRKKYLITSNTARTITVSSGLNMTTVGAVGTIFRVEAALQMSGGYDGIAGIVDSTYQTAYDTSVSPLKQLRGKNVGLLKLATPGVTATAVQRAGAAFAESQNWQYRYEVPANKVDEASVEEYINSTLGRNDFAVVAWPSYMKISNPAVGGKGLKLISNTGMIHGREARFAADYKGFHKAAAGEDAILSEAAGMPDGMEDHVFDEEFLNPIGIAVIKLVKGNFVIWGDRTVSVDSAHRFKHQREYMSHLENTLLENYGFIIFALNNADQHPILRSQFQVYFQGDFAAGALDGKSAEDSVTIKIDEENNTDATKLEGDLLAEIGVHVVNTVERFIIGVSRLGVTEKTA